MNEDYLWDKTGGDAEIEKLENALQAFRCRESAPPALPASMPVVEEKRARKFFDFRFVYAFVPTAAAVLILFAVWFQMPGGNSSLENDTAKTNVVPVERRNEIDSAIDTPSAPPEKTIPAPLRNKSNVVKTRQPVAAKPRAGKTAERRAKPEEIILTAEERYAYEQLMLALSITSSKLKIVKDKVEGIEEQNAVLTNRK